ncbi:MAG: hypothetical protein Q9222_004330 [Ikaeria aurantiellina]
MDNVGKSYDFIVVGGGPAGCVLATRLARSLKSFQVLLIEAGGDNRDPKHQSYGDRHWTFATAPGYDWGYTTVPQKHLQGREIGYSRGKGLGGSTAINFCVFTRGSKVDYDTWAHRVGDDAWTWEHVLQRFKEVSRKPDLLGTDLLTTTPLSSKRSNHRQMGTKIMYMHRRLCMARMGRFAWCLGFQALMIPDR